MLNPSVKVPGSNCKKNFADFSACPKNFWPNIFRPRKKKRVLAITNGTWEVIMWSVYTFIRFCHPPDWLEWVRTLNSADFIQFGGPGSQVTNWQWSLAQWAWRMTKKIFQENFFHPQFWGIIHCHQFPWGLDPRSRWCMMAKIWIHRKRRSEGIKTVFNSN